MLKFELFYRNIKLYKQKYLNTLLAHWEYNLNTIVKYYKNYIE